MKPLTVLVVDMADLEMQREFMSPAQCRKYLYEHDELNRLVDKVLEIEGFAYGLHFLLLHNVKEHEYLAHVCMNDNRILTEDNDDQLNILYTATKIHPTERALIEMMCSDYAIYVKQLKDARLPQIH